VCVKFEQITLRGPSSPIELMFSSLCRSAHLKQVNIDGTSVNCVALDQEPHSSTSRLIVAANVGIAHRSGNIMARCVIIIVDDKKLKCP